MSARLEPWIVLEELPMPHPHRRRTLPWLALLPLLGLVALPAAAQPDPPPVRVQKAKDKLLVTLGEAKAEGVVTARVANRLRQDASTLPSDVMPICTTKALIELRSALGMAILAKRDGDDFHRDLSRLWDLMSLVPQAYAPPLWLMEELTGTKVEFPNLPQELVDQRLGQVSGGGGDVNSLGALVVGYVSENFAAWKCGQER